MHSEYTEIVLRLVPRILTLGDRNPASPTYGCADRNYFHYKISDFPSGMYQLVALPLALLYSRNFEGNIYYQKKEIRDLSLATIRFAMKSSHKDGSCDEFFYNERAVGATAISLYEMVQAYKIIGEYDAEIEEFFRRRARWLIKNWKEPKVKANHIAAIALALAEVGFKEDAKRFARATLKLQNENGAYREHGGEDYGYHSITINFLAQYWRLTKDREVLDSLKKAVDWIYPIVKEDKGFLPATGSRKCSQFCILGFTILRKGFPKAEEVVKIWNKYNCSPSVSDDRYIVDELTPFLELIN